MSGAPATLSLYRGLTLAAAPLLGRLLRSRLAQGKEIPGRVQERRGVASVARPDGPLIWIHAVSVGETMSILPVVANVLRRDSGLSVLITTSTVTSAQLVAERVASPRVIHQFAPLDQPKWVERFLAHWRPDLGLIVESEFWPNLLLGARARGVPLILLNARLSQKSFLGWLRAPKTIAHILSVFSLCLAQNAETARRLRELGAGAVHCFGNLKFAASPLPDPPELRDALIRALGHRPRWLAASIHPGEDRDIAEAHLALRARWPGILTLIVPRHPERGPQMAETFSALGLKTRRRALGEMPGPDTEIYIADTLGELGAFCRQSSIVLMGGSLIPHGGQNPLEPARLGVAILCGPHTENFTEIYAQFDAARALKRVATAAELADAVAFYLTDEPARAAAAERGRSVAMSAADVLPQIMAAVAPYLPAANGERDARA